MDMIYAQVINGMVNLIGGEEVGLPVFNHPLVTCIDITDMPEEERPKIGWYYIFDENQKGHFSEIPPFVPEPQPEPKPTILDEIKSMMLVTINNLAAIYPEQVDAELLAVLIQEGKRKIEDAPPDKRAEVQELIKKEV